MKSFIPVLFVRDVSASAEYLRTTLGFAVDFLHGTPPFYGAVSRDEVCLHLRFVRRPNFAELAALEDSNNPGAERISMSVTWTAT